MVKVGLDVPRQDVGGSSGLSGYLDRRAFLRSGGASAVGGALLLGMTQKSGGSLASGGDIRVGMVGCGAQGERLRNAASFLSGFRFSALCDIWPYNLGRMHRTMQSYARRGGEDARMYGEAADNEAFTDYEEMLDKMRGKMDAVFLPTPDLFHAPYTRMALEMGYHVYCEKMMANTYEAAADMVKAQEENPNYLLQIGHQRRSNPRYLHLRNEIVLGNELLGRVTHAKAQWNRGFQSSQPLLPARGADIPQEVLAKHGFADMFEFLNWRMFRKFGGGIISDLGAHQIDLFNWFFDSRPSAVVASGGVDFWGDWNVERGFPAVELEDNVMAIYEYDTPKGKARAYYQVLTTTGSLGVFESFMGIDGAASINEVSMNEIYREPSAPSWEPFSRAGIIAKDIPEGHNKFWQAPQPWKGRPERHMMDDLTATAGVSKALDAWQNPATLDLPAHAPHIQNFFDAIRGDGRDPDPGILTCPVQVAFETCVTVMKSIDAIAGNGRAEFTEADFDASSYDGPGSLDGTSADPGAGVEELGSD
jgi:predicted dehydrogenase